MIALKPFYVGVYVGRKYSGSSQLVVSRPTYSVTRIDITSLRHFWWVKKETTIIRAGPITVLDLMITNFIHR